MECAKTVTLGMEVRLLSRKTIAVEAPDTPVSQILTQAGFRVVPLTGQALQHAQAIVVTGMDDHFLGREDPLTKAPVIDSDGMTPEEVLSEVNRRAL